MLPFLRTDKKSQQVQLDLDPLTAGRINQVIPLDNNSLVIDLIQCFIKNRPFSLDKDELIHSLYNPKKPCSDRQIRCLNHNMIKLISRARVICRNWIKKTDSEIIDWFPYDPYSQTWDLYRLRPHSQVKLE